MKLCITTPLQIVVDQDAIVSLQAEDASGRFGILPGHADFLTSLAVSVVTWKGLDDKVHYCAVRRGVLSVTGGQHVAIATREAVAGDDLALLDRDVIARYRADLETQRVDHVASTRLQLNAVRMIMQRLRPGGPGDAGSFR